MLVVSYFSMIPVFVSENQESLDYLNEILRDRNQYVTEENYAKVAECDDLLDSLDVREISDEEVLQKMEAYKLEHLYFLLRMYLLE